MEVHLTPENESQLHQVARRTGKGTAELVQDAVDRFLEYDARFIEAVEQGRAAARCGELVEHEAVVERIERMLRL